MGHKNKRAPLFFIGHGSPMNALAKNSYTQRLGQLANLYPKPKAIVCISAHWLTKGTFVTHAKMPKTIHDFYGFPDELFAVDYPAPGAPDLAEQIGAKSTTPPILLDEEWGLDHGTWSILRHIFPQANIPTLQLSINISQPPEYHYELGKKISYLRDHEVLIIGSGNVVHNLRTLQWTPQAEPYNWAIEFNDWVKDQLSSSRHLELVNNPLLHSAGKQSIPTMDHWYPLLYILGASDKSDLLNFEYEEIQNSSISMLSFSFKPNF